MSLSVIGLSFIIAFHGLEGLGRRESADRIPSREIRSSADLLRRQFAEVTPLRHLDGDDGGSAISFEGDTRAVRFVAPTRGDADGAGLVVVALSIERHVGVVNVWHVVAPLDPGADRWGETRPGSRRLLIGGLEEATVAYLGAPYAHHDIEWRTEWPRDAARFPDAVRLRTVARDGDHSWPDLYFPIPAGRAL